MMLLKLAWRNLWRNVRRTTLSVLALALGVTAIVTLNSFREVANRAMIGGLTRGFVGHAQVHGRGYQESPDLETVVTDPDAVEASLARALPGIRAEKRVLGAGLAGSGDVATAVMVMGIEPGSAQGTLTIERGRGLGAAPAGEAVLGRGLADELGSAPGGEIVLVGQAADGSLANDRFTVVGVADAGSSEANATAVFLDLPDAQSFYALGGSVHQLVVRLPTDDEDVSRPVARLRAALDPGKLEILSWDEMLPELKSAIDAKRRNQRVIEMIVFLIVALGVLNTMTMSTFERTRELGVMASLGTRRGRILRMVVLEALLQGLIGYCVGVAAAWILLRAIGTADFSSLGGDTDIMGARLPSTVRLAVDGAALVSAALVTVVTMLAGGLIPAVRAARLKPVEATRYV